MDAQALRAELKQWEREFRASNGCDASIDDIKQQPLIAGKYKLYKKLSKLPSAPIATAFTVDLSNPPSTPPRPRTSAKPSLVPKSRAVHLPVPTISSNPFSPAKGKATLFSHAFTPAKSRTRESHGDDLLAPPAGLLPNPFVTPSKGNILPDARTSTSGPSDSFNDPPPQSQSIPHSSIFAAAADFRLPELTQPPQSQDAGPSSAILRARKRLRGEPVSPSPSKDKRRKLSLPRVPSKSSLTFGGASKAIYSPAGAGTDHARKKKASQLLMSDPESSDEDNDGRGGIAVDGSFVDDSPVKAPTGGRAFKLLFEGSPSKPRNGRKGTSEALSRAASSDAAGPPSSTGAPSDDEEDDVDMSEGEDFPANGHAKKGKEAVVNGKGKERNGARIPTARVPGKAMNDLFSEVVPQKVLERQRKEEEANAGKRKKGKARAKEEPQVPEPKPQPRPNKRASEERADMELIPPSPPAKGARKRWQGYGKGKGKKKEDTQEEEEEDEHEDEDSETEHGVKVYEWGASASFSRSKGGQADEKGDGFDLDDPELGVHPFSRFTPRRLSFGPEGEAKDEENLEVSLPEHLRAVLALSPPKRRDEDRVVKGLLEGDGREAYRRMGGEVWGVGEDEWDGEDTEGDDEWEGEGVPWEVGEM